MSKTQKSLFAAFIVTLAGIAMAFAGSHMGLTFNGRPVFAIAVALTFLINWTAFIPANLNQTEKFYDITGSITYLLATWVAFFLSGNNSIRAVLVTLFVSVWALRLGTFLFKRIHADGKDGRFDAIKTNPARFFTTWTLQALWVVMTAACAWAIITGDNPQPLGVWGLLGVALWIGGFAIEVVADRQKSTFRANPDNHGKFINEGLWSWSQHPNYFGEITLWTGIALMAVEVLQGGQWLTLLSPVFVIFLLMRISGVPLLQQRGDAKWGHDPAYQAYRKHTSLLIPIPPRKKVPVARLSSEEE